MPSIDPQAESLFAAAAELSGEARKAFLDRECAGREQLRAQLEGLLRAHDRVNHAIDRPAAQHDRLAATCLADAQAVGSVIAGRYKLLEQIGEGGMGTVWVAEQLEPVKRKVALKLIKAGMDSNAVLARFEAERQALAMMDHPNIAKVLDGGMTDAGRPYFVMEYVKGVPITEYCDSLKLNVPERLDLFVQVCSAVQHAHQKGIIHRDLKPSNILVAPYDDKPVPKVIDFGLAKALHQRLTERTLHTAHETVIGTPLYMSPEQAQLNNLDVDTRSDIYSLGVLLYELLTGTTPLEKARFKEVAWDEVRRIIREEEPPRPSTRLSSTGTLPSLAACRQTEPIKLTQQLKGELDWIVMKALEKERTRRYETANGLARDVQRYLDGESVEACPPTLRYRLNKTFRKHRTAILTAGAFAAVLLVASAVSLAFGVLARQSARQAKLEWLRAEANAAKATKDRIFAQEKLEEATLARQELEVERNKLIQKDYATSLQLADNAVSDYRPARARTVLDAAPVELRGWEWNYLKRQSQSQHLFELQHQHDPNTFLTSVSFTADGSSIATVARGPVQWSGDDGQKSSWTGDVQVWDAATGQERFTLCRNVSNIHSAVCSRIDKQRLLTVQDDAVIVWDVATRAEVLRLVPETGLQFAGATFSPDGTRIATQWRIPISRGADRFEDRYRGWNEQPDGIRIWDAATGQQLASMQGSRDMGFGVAFGPEGAWLVSRQLERTETDEFRTSIKFWNAQTGEELFTFGEAQLGPDTRPWGFGLSADGSRFAVTSNSTTFTVGSTQVFRLTTEQGRPALSDHSVTLQTGSGSNFTRIAGFSPDSRQVSLVQQNRASIWDCDSGTELRVLPGDTDYITGVSWSSNGEQFVTSDNGGATKIWDARIPQALPVIKHDSGFIQAVSFSPTGDRIMTTASDGTRIWNARSLEMLREFPTEQAANFYSQAFSPDGRWLVRINGNLATLYDTSTGKEVNVLQSHTERISASSFSQDGSRLLLSNNDWTISVWDVGKGQELFRLGEPAPAASPGYTLGYFTPDGRQILVEHLVEDAYTIGAIKLHDAQTGEVVRSLAAGKFRYTASKGAFSADGTKYVGYFISDSPSAEGFRVWDVATGNELNPFQGHWDRVVSLAISPDGKRIVTASNDLDNHTVKIWLVDSGAELLSLSCNDRVLSACFSPDGNQIVAAVGAQLQFWDGTPVAETNRK